MLSIRITKRLCETLILAVFVVAGAVGLVRTLTGQEIVWVADGLGWDGVHYDRLLKFFSGQGTPTEPAEFPLCGRIGTAWILIHVFGGKIGYYEFNLAVSASFAILFVATTASMWRGSPKALAAALAIPCFLIFSPIRFTNFYPVYMDPPFLLMLVLALHLVAKGMYLWGGAVCVFAIPFREAAFYLIPLFASFSVINSRHRAGTAILGVALVIAGFLVKGLVLQVTSCEGQPQLRTALYWLYQFLSDPSRFLDVTAALSLTLGPLLLVQWKQTSMFDLRSNGLLAFSVAALAYVAALSIMGGSDVTRIFYSFIPLYAPVLIAGFARLDLSGFALACLGWLVTNQTLGTYQQPISSVPNNDLSGFFSQFPDHAHPVVAVVILGTWLVLRLLHGACRRIEEVAFAQQ